MQAYLAIFKRDAKLQPLNLPMPFFGVMVITLLLCITNTVVTGILLLWGSLFCCTLMVNELKIGHSHALAFMLPHFKVIQFNYCLGLCVLMVLTTGLLLASNLGEMVFWSMFTLFCVSLIFLLVNHSVILVMVSFIVSVVLFAIILTLSDGTILVKQLVHGVAAGLSYFGDAKLWLAALILGVLSGLNLFNSRSRYMRYRPYQEQDLPSNWQPTALKAETPQSSIISVLLPHKMYRVLLSVKGVIDNWLQYGFRPSGLVRLSHDPSIKGAILLSSIGFLTLMLGFSTILFYTKIINDLNFVATLQMSIVILLVTFSVTNDFISQQTSLARIWLMYPAESRCSYANQVLMVFVNRYLRALSLAIIIFGLWAWLTLDLAAFTPVFTHILLSVLVTGIISANMVLWLAPRWHLSTWAAKVIAATVNFSYLLSFWVPQLRLQNLSSVEGFIVFALLDLIGLISLIFAVRYWRNNGLQLLT